MTTDTSFDDRPLVTFALIAYNQEAYIREAIEGAFSQTYEPLEIILSDDCSSDRTFEIMQEMMSTYDGPHKVILRKNPKNLGLATHVNQIIEIANGSFIALAAGDDISLNRRVEHAVAALLSEPESSFYESGYHSIDRNGLVIQEHTSPFATDRKIRIEDLIEGNIKGLTGAARTYRMAAIEKFRPLDPACPTEDSTFVLRCLMIGPGEYIVTPDVQRRMHDNNLSGASSLKNMDYSSLWRQYRADAQHARKNEYISAPTYASVSHWISRTALVRTLQQKSEYGGKALLTECATAFTCNEYRSLSRQEILRLTLKALVRFVVKT